VKDPLAPPEQDRLQKRGGPADEIDPYHPLAAR
jgi:hypothetical protein